MPNQQVPALILSTSIFLFVYGYALYRMIYGWKKLKNNYPKTGKVTRIPNWKLHSPELDEEKIS